MATCTFTTSLAAGVAGAGSQVAPIPPATGTGARVSEHFGLLLFVIGAAIAFAWSLLFGAFLASGRRNREEPR